MRRMTSPGRDRTTAPLRFLGAFPVPAPDAKAWRPKLLRPSMVEALWWLGVFVASAVVESALRDNGLQRADFYVSAHLVHLSSGLRVLWSAGTPISAGCAYLVATTVTAQGWRKRLGAWALFCLSAAAEILLKHFGVGGRLPAQGVYLVRVPSGLLVHAQHAAAEVGGYLGIHGAFPSGHTLRLTLIAGYARPRPNRTLPIAVGAASCVVATLVGGHTLAQGLGGVALGLTGLAVVGRLRVDRQAPLRERP